jgi:hypothetical protein
LKVLVMNKLCKICLEEKPFDGTAKTGTKASGFQGRTCWDCYVTASREVTRCIRATAEGRAKAREANREANRRARSTPEGRAKANAASREYKQRYRANPENRAKNNAVVREAMQRRLATPEGKEYAIRKARERQLKIKQVTPAWSDPAARAEFYALRDEINSHGIYKVVCDHIVPLRGRNACGLHCEFNLQVIEWHENASKSNQHEP